MTISERIFQIMDERGLTIYRLAKITGISYHTINDWRHKKTNPGADKIMLLCVALEVTPEMLLTGKGRDEYPFKNHEEVVQEDELDIEKEILMAYRGLSDSKKNRLMAYLNMLQNNK